MEPQKTLKRNRDLEKEKQSWRNHTALCSEERLRSLTSQALHYTNIPEKSSPKTASVSAPGDLQKIFS